jgi:hypothetical protein
VDQLALVGRWEEVGTELALDKWEVAQHRMSELVQSSTLVVNCTVDGWEERTRCQVVVEGCTSELVQEVECRVDA